MINIFKHKNLRKSMKKEGGFVINSCNQPISFYNNISYFKLNSIVTII